MVPSPSTALPEVQFLFNWGKETGHKLVQKHFGFSLASLSSTFKQDLSSEKSQFMAKVMGENRAINTHKCLAKDMILFLVMMSRKKKQNYFSTYVVQ